MMRRRVLAAVGLAVLTGLAYAALAADQPAEAGKVLMDEWRATYVGDRKAGYEHESTREVQTADGVFFVTTIHSEVALSRAGVPLAMLSDSVVRENAQGMVVEFQHKSPMTQTTRGTLDAR